MTTTEKPSLLEMLRSLSERCDCGECRGEAGPKRTQDLQARILRDSYVKLVEPFDKKPGALLIQKKGIFSGYKFPENCVVIVSKVFDPPIPSTDAQSTNHFGRSLDISVLSIMNSDTHGENIVEFIVDSRFFEPYTGEVA